jgi:hypothetical protein
MKVCAYQSIHSNSFLRGQTKRRVHTVMMAPQSSTETVWRHYTVHKVQIKDQYVMGRMTDLFLFLTMLRLHQVQVI